MRIYERLATDVVEYIELGGNDGWGGKTKKDHVTLKNVYFEDEESFGRTGRETVIISNATLYYFPLLTGFEIDIKKESEILYEGKVYVVERVKRVQELYGNKTHQYEIGLI